MPTPYISNEICSKMDGWIFHSPILIIVTMFGSINGSSWRSVLNLQLFKDVLDEALCDEQLTYITNNNTHLLYQFLDAGLRLPKGYTNGNRQDVGMFGKCLAIHDQLMTSNVEGKYCVIQMSMTKNMTSLESFGFKRFGADDRTNLTLAACIPKTCTTQQGLRGLYNDSDLQFSDILCRLPNDKLWTAAEYTMIIVAGLLGFVTALSTGYDIYQTLILKKDVKEVSVLLRCCSLYTNTRNLFTFSESSTNIDCIDGVRSLSVLWIILLHMVHLRPVMPDYNHNERYSYRNQIKSFWISSGHVAVDSFFMMTGLLLVYTKIGKTNRSSFLKNLHIFYFQRFMRLFPVLAFAVLLQASVLHRIWDGPNTSQVFDNTINCRTHWWASIFFIVNFFGYSCLPHTWYLSVDMQFYILSPLIFVWLFGRRRTAWIALIVCLFVTLAGSVLYIYMVPGNVRKMFVTPHYYTNTLMRVPAIIVGMIVGYMLKTCDKKMHTLSVVITWLLAVLVTTVVMLSKFFQSDFYADYVQLFSRPLWAAAVGWMIFACVRGYGGPINWFLSLRCWKLTSRLSYALYIMHNPIRNSWSSSVMEVGNFTAYKIMEDFVVVLAMSWLAATLVTVLVDAPCVTLTRLATHSGVPNSKSMEKENE